MSRPLARRILVATSLILTLGVGCGSSGGGCAGLKPLPKDPQPLGFPTDQLIEGGMQARITKPGMDKLTGSISKLFGSALGNGFCASQQTSIYNFLGQSANACEQPSPSCKDSSGNAANGCTAYVYLDSSKRPASHQTGDTMPPVAAGDNDGKDKIVITVQDSPPAAHPQIVVDAWLDILVPVKLVAHGIFSGSCYLYAYTDHVDAPAGDGNEPMHITATIGVTTDPVTGELALNLDNLSIPNIGLTTDSNGGVCGFLSAVASAGLSFLNSLPQVITDFIINLLKPLINNLLQSFLPKPLGLAGVMDSGKLLASLEPPADTNLELFVVPGGYVGSSAGGLTLGIMSGVNSDRDETTRTPGLTSEPNFCVPSRPTPDLSTAPWMLPFNATRKDFVLSPAGPFAGMPDPTDSMGNLQDVAIGISRTFLDLAGFHIYNSGTMCLHIGGSTIPQLNGGTLSVLIGSLGNILEDRKAPLALVLRPQTPLNFTIGAGSMMDPLIHIAVEDLRIDFYAWIEERYVRILTLGLDMNIGVNLTVTMDPTTMKPAIQPTLSGLDAKNVKIRVSNTDLLQEPPAQLQQLFPTLINIATGAIGGVIKPIALPAVAGFSLDDLSISKVQTSQDDFLGIFATIVNTTPESLVDWSDPLHPRLVGQLRMQGTLAKVDVPTQAELQQLFANGSTPSMFDVTARPRVTLNLGAEGAPGGQPVEYAYRVDGGMWHDWFRDTNPVIADDAFLLQGFHTLDLRSRVVNKWSTESAPQSIRVLIDSVPPEVHPALDGNDPTRVDFNGFDIVSDTSKLTYAYVDATGRLTPFTPDDGMTLQLMKQLTSDGHAPLQLSVMDEAGNVGAYQVQLADVNGFHGRTTNPPPSGGCGCSVGGASDPTSTKLGLLAVAAFAVMLVWRRRRALLWVLCAGALGAVFGCGNSNQCSIDDDCSSMACPGGQVAQCQSSMCICAPDIVPGDVGRFSSMAMIGSNAYVAAYNTYWGDLMIGHVTPPGVVPTWDFVDGFPDEGPTSVTNSHIRGGVEDKGDDVGRYTSIQATADGQPIIAYYDKTHGALKFTSFNVIRWKAHVVDKGTGTPDHDGDDIGRWASMSLDKNGKPMIAYTATQMTGTKSGMPEGQLRVAQAKTATPEATSDWTVVIVDSRPLPVASMPDGGAADGGSSAPYELLPEGIGLMPSLARKPDDTPGIAYYDRTRGNLRYVEYLPQTGAWSTPVILDGEDPTGNDTGDVGLYPSLAYDESSVGHISYEDSTHDNLLYMDTMKKMVEVVDNGYRPGEETTLDGLNSPVYHLVGDSSSIQTVSGKVVIAYQDSTVEQLRIAQRGTDGKWMTAVVAGHAMPFKGAYGFYANLRISNKKGVISSYAINQQLDNPLYYVELFSVDLGLIM
jgi:MYXO-CTERM domain-containing protein